MHTGNTKESLVAMALHCNGLATKIAELQAEHGKLVASLKAEEESESSLLQ
jgi:hypothetical protein